MGTIWTSIDTTTATEGVGIILKGQTYNEGWMFVWPQYRNYEHHCSASLIQSNQASNIQLILTAAHCLLYVVVISYLIKI